MMDPYKSSYGVEDPEFAITQLAQTTMRSEIGKISLGKYLHLLQLGSFKDLNCLMIIDQL